MKGVTDKKHLRQESKEDGPSDYASLFVYEK